MTEILWITGLVLILCAIPLLLVPQVWGWLAERTFDLLVPQRDTGLGDAGIVGQEATLLGPFTRSGESGVWRSAISVRGESWTAESRADLPPAYPGRVLVAKVEGLVAIVVLEDRAGADQESREET